MLTLQELKNIVERAADRKQVPSYRALRESKSRIVVSATVDRQTEIVVYENGFVVYRVGRHNTVFPLYSCAEYSYELDQKNRFYLWGEFFEKENWYLRLVLEGEDRMIKNQDWYNSRKQISYSAIAEDWDELAQEDNALHKLMKREGAEELLQMMTERQRIVVKKYYMEQLREDEIAKELGITQQAVSDTLRKAIRRVRRKINIEKNGRIM